MGTSASSDGPGSGVSFDPPWLDDVELPNTEQSPDGQQPPDGEKQPTPSPYVSPLARFRGARTNLGEYIKSGSTDSLRRSLGHYSKTGMGGARNVASRMRLSTGVGSGLFRTLQSVRDGNNQTLVALFSKLKAENADAYQFIDAIIGNVCPSGGSIDETSCRDSVSSAMSDFLESR